MSDEKKRVSLNSVKSVFKTIIWPRKKLVFIGLLLIAINRAAGLVLPGATKYLIDDAINNADMNLLELIILAVSGAILIQSLSSFLLTKLLSVEAHYLITELRIKVQRHILRLKTNFFDHNKSGELVSRIMTDATGVRNLIGTGLVHLLGGVITSIGSLIILININAMMTIYVFVPLIIFGIVSLKAFNYIRPIFRERYKIDAEVVGRLTETLGGIRIIKGFNAEEREDEVFSKGVHRLYANVKKSLITTSLMTSGATLLMGITSTLIIYFGGSLIIQNEMTVGDFFAFTLYLGFLIAPIVQMSNIGTQITDAFAGLDRIEDIFTNEVEGLEKERSHELERIKGDVEFENVTFSYEKDSDIIKHISFNAEAGTTVALVGSSGAGKSTIAGLAATFLKPDSGTIRVDGLDLNTIKLDSFRSQLAVVLQDEFLFDGSIKDNIRFPRPNASDEDIKKAIKAAHVNEFTDRFDDGLDTIIGERGVRLSGGQRQRVALARAILADPRILILDEATSSLDTESEAFIQESLSHLLKGRTTFVIAHRLSTIRQADQILVVDNGEIIESGTHDELIKKDGKYSTLYTVQARI